MENNSFAGLLKLVQRKRAYGAYIKISITNYYLKEVPKSADLLAFDPSLPHIKDSYFMSTFKHPN